MKITLITNILHKINSRCKNAYLVVFGLSILLIFVASPQVYGESIVGSVLTKVSYTAGSETKNFETTENNVANALSENGIKLSKNDITIPPLSTSLIGGKISVTLVPARSVLIDDNGQSWVGKSAYTSSTEILNQLGVIVDKADKVSIELILNPEKENMAGQRITIKRAPVYTVSVDGKKLVVHSWGKTVADVLKDGGVELNENDTTDPTTDSLAPISGQIEVTRVNYADVDENESVAYSTIYKIDSSLPLGSKRVDQAGVTGKISKKYHVVYNNGVEISRTQISSSVVVQVANQIISTGAQIGAASYVSDGTYAGYGSMVAAFKDTRIKKGSKVLVTNLNTGTQIIVTVVDRGPYVDGRIIDLTETAFRALGGLSGQGVLYNVSVQAVI